MTARETVSAPESNFDAFSGNAIPPEAAAKLFQPFYRDGEVRKSSQGLGLGLFISSEIAKAHGGYLTVASDARETSFTLRMPLSQLG